MKVFSPEDTFMFFIDKKLRVNANAVLFGDNKVNF